jgi:hypothetical protein
VLPGAIVTPASKSFDFRLARYALAGASALGGPAVAQAGIVFTPVTPPNSISGVGQWIDVNMNLSADALAEFRLSAFVNASFYNGTDVQPFGATGLSGPLIFGEEVTTSNTLAGYQELWKIAPIPRGAWYAANMSSGYLGVRFTVSGQEYLGWAELTNVSPYGLTLNGYAYNDVPGEPILAGQTSVTPEPSSLALFAAGAAGLLALRRRRSAA